MSGYFEKLRGSFSLYYDAAESSDTRYLLMRFGESVDRVLEVFWKEHPAESFSVVPLVAYGDAPRLHLCSQKSLAAALASVQLEPGSSTEQAWKAACEYHKVAWPKRLAA
jgi:hypothetical protein